MLRCETLDIRRKTPDNHKKMNTQNFNNLDQLKTQSSELRASKPLINTQPFNNSDIAHSSLLEAHSSIKHKE